MESCHILFYQRDYSEKSHVDWEIEQMKNENLFIEKIKAFFGIKETIEKEDQRIETGGIIKISISDFIKYFCLLFHSLSFIS
jgi:hypothetical protein